MIDDYLKQSYNSMKSLELLKKAKKIKEQFPCFEVWADYAFLAACHVAAIDDRQRCNDIITAIKSTFPDYDPSPRFNWGQRFTNDKSELLSDRISNKKELIEDQTLFERTELMLKFISQNPTFSFETYFGKYFSLNLEMFLKLYK